MIQLRSSFPNPPSSRKVTNSNPVRLMFLTTGLHIGGNERSVLILAQALNRAPFEISVAHLRNPGFVAEQLRKVGISVFNLRLERGLSFLARPRVTVLFRRLLHFHRIDVIHAYNFLPNLLGALAAWGTSARLIASRVQMPDRFSKIQHRWANRLVARQATFIHYNTWAGLCHTLECYVPSAKARLIPSPFPVPPDDARERGEQLKNRIGIHPDQLVVGFVGSLRPIKNPAMFVEIALKILEHRKDVMFLLAGDGSERARLEDRVRCEGQAANFRFLGWVNDTSAVFPALDILVLTSHSESPGIVIMEAMSHGIPVIATEVGAVPELVADEQTGYLIADCDVDASVKRICNLLDLDSLRDDMGRRARQIIKQSMGERTVIGEMERMYFEALG